MAVETLIDRRDTGAGVDDGVASVLDPAVALVDRAIACFAGRSIVAASEVVDQLLDVRSALSRR